MTTTTLDEHTRWVAITDLQEHPANPKDHSIPELRASMRRLGFMDPLVTDGRTGLLIAGHGRRKALLAMAEDGEDPPAGVRQDGEVWLVPVFEGWASADDDEALTALVALNRLTETGGWHTEPLVELLDRLAGMDSGLAGTGYDEGELDSLRAQLAKFNPPEEPERVHDQGDPVSELGDVWQVGPHLVACGNAYDTELRDRLLEGRKVGMLLSDPPYGMRLQTDYSMRDKDREDVNGDMVFGNAYRQVEGDGEDFDPTPLLDAWGTEAREVFLWGADWYYEHLPRGGSWVVWDKRSHDDWDAEDEKLDSMAKWTGNHFEMCWSRVHHRRVIIRKLWIARNARDDGERRLHPTQKPVDVLERILATWAKPDMLVADPFAGVGSTAVAAVRTGHTTVSVELDPLYVDGAVRRLQRFTGEDAVNLTREGIVPPVP